MKMIDGGKDPTKEYPNNADFILWPTTRIELKVGLILFEIWLSNLWF